MAPDLKSAWNEIDTDKLIDMDGDPLYSLVKRSPSKRRNRRHQSTYAVKQKEIDEERSKTPSSVIHEKELDFENALAGKLYLATRFSEKLQVDPMFNNTGVRFRLNVLQDKQTSVNSRNKFLPPLDVNTMKHSSLNKDIFDGSEDNNKLLIANENEIVDDNDERLTEQEKVVMKEREMLEKIRNKERMRTREKAKFERKLKKMSSKVDIMENKTSGEMSTPLIPEVMYKKRSTKKKGARRKITMNSISPSESNMETDNESQNDRKSNQRQTPSNIDNMGNSYDLNDISTFRPFSSPFHTHNAVSPYPLAPAFPMAATSLYQHVPFQQSYDLFRQPTFDDRAQMTLNSTLNASWNPKNETDKSGFVPMILPNGRCQPRSAVRLVAENELELLEKAQQRARRKMQYVLQKSVSESTNISMSEC